MAVLCTICEKIFSKQCALNRHMREVHNMIPSAVSFDQSKWTYKCLEPNCNTSYQQNKSLISHLKETHNQVFDTEEKTFTNISDFEIWKSNIEEEIKCNYVVSSTAHSTRGKVTYYNCNRTRTGRLPCTDRVRQLKSQFSCKLDHGCTSQIKVIEEDKINIFWQKTHYGHAMELQHIRLSKPSRETVAMKLISGIPTTTILDQAREKIGEQLSRIDLLTSKDINNIRKKYKIDLKDGKRHENDAISVDLWVKENSCKIGAENPILLYKQQGVHLDDFELNDFCLVIMNTFQETMLRKFGNNTILIDGTHGLNNYDFELTTIMIVDEFGEGFPVCFMFSNRKDTHVYEAMFEAIKGKVGSIATTTFMSDLADAFYKAWSSTMGSVVNRLFCSWHVDQAWQHNLLKIKCKEKRNNVYKILKVLQNELDEAKFEINITSSLQLMLGDKDTEGFGRYFHDNYMKNYKQWAYCYRKKTGTNTNMRLESMHKTIKYYYLGKKKVKRLDRGLHAVLKFLKNKCVERIIKLVKGKNTTYKAAIFKQHKIALKSNFEINKSAIFWEVTYNDKTHFVQRILEFSCCELACSVCNICVHVYNCSCYDYVHTMTICKHIHYISLKSEAGSSSRVENIEQIEEVQSLSASLKQTEKIMNSQLEEKVVHTFQTLMNCDLMSLDDTTIFHISSHLDVLKNLAVLPKFEGHTTPFQSSSNNEPVNKNINPQLRFHSTKRKRKISKNIICKPSKEEEADIKNILSHKPVPFISNTTSNDHNYI